MVYKICRNEFDILKTAMDNHRARFLARRVKEEAIKGNIKKAKKIKNIMDREIERKTWVSIVSDLQK